PLASSLVTNKFFSGIRGGRWRLGVGNPIEHFRVRSAWARRPVAERARRPIVCVFAQSKNPRGGIYTNRVKMRSPRLITLVVFFVNRVSHAIGIQSQPFFRSNEFPRI